VADFHAIGGASATLRTLLADRMDFPDGVTPIVTVGPPAFSTKDVNPRREDPRVNVFLYRVTENAFLQNQQIPGRELSGYGHPPLSVNLHYLVTAYGNAQVPDDHDALFDDTIAHYLLGSAMRVLHDTPIVTEQLLTIRAPSGREILDTSLRGEFEQVKLTLEPLTLEDVTKVWTALGLRFRLSAAYVANVVQIESERQRTYPRPVGRPLSPLDPPLPTDPPAPGPMVYVPTLQTPTITDLHVVLAPGGAEQAYPYARVGDTLALMGTALSGLVTEVWVGDLSITAGTAKPTRVEAALPDDAQLQPGLVAVKVTVSDPHVPGSRFDSNDTPLMVVPRVNAVAPIGPPRAVAVDGVRLFTGVAGGETVIGRAVVPRESYANPSQTHIEVPLPDTLPSRRVRALVGAPLGGPVAFAVGPQELDLVLSGVAHTARPYLEGTLEPAEIAATLEAAIHDVSDAPGDGYAGARVALLGTGLAIVGGGLTNPIAFGGASPLRNQLGLGGAQPAGAAHAFVSGALQPLPTLSAGTPLVQATVGGVIADVAVPAAFASLEELAAALEAAMTGAGFAGTRVGVTRSQLMVVPGNAADVSFAATAADSTTVVELQLHGRFPVRVRAQGAESIDDATLELPQ